jgi:hypothetical protein
MRALRPVPTASQRDAIAQVPGDGDDTVLAALHDLEQAISLLDHRRYDAENRLANAKLANADRTRCERDVAALVAELPRARDARGRTPR